MINKMELIENLKRFGLNFHDLPNMISNIDLLLRGLALDIDPRNERPIGVIQYIWLVFLVGCYVYVYEVSMVWSVWLCKQSGDLVGGVIVFSLSVLSFLSMIKIAGLFYYRSDVRKMVSEYLRCDADVVPGSRFVANIKPTLRATKKRCIIIWIFVFMNGAIYLFIPILKPGNQMPEEKLKFLGVENVAQQPTYTIMFFINVIAGLATSYPATSVTVFFIVINAYIKAQILALSEEMKLIWDDALTQYNTHLKDSVNSRENNEKNNFLNSYVRNKLANIYKIHVMNINLFLKVEGVFQKPIAIQILLFIIGIIAVLLGGLEKTYLQLPFATLFVCIDCITGQMIIDASVIFEQAVYDSKWENFDVNNRKTVLLMLQNSQRTMKLSAGGIAYLNLEYLMAVFKMTYSAYTTLRTTMN